MNAESNDGSLAVARADLAVAAAAALCAVALTVGVRFGTGSAPPVIARMAPLAPYFLYLIVRRRIGDGPLSQPRGWIVLVIAITVAIAAFYAA